MESLLKKETAELYIHTVEYIQGVAAGRVKPEWRNKAGKRGGFSPSNIGSKRADPPMVAQQSDNFLLSSHRCVKKAIKIIRNLTPMRA